MRWSLRQSVALVLLVVMTINLCVWDSSRGRVAHQLVHIGMLDDNAGNHSHAALPSEVVGKTKLAHQVLHAVDHLQLFPNTQVSLYQLAAAPAVFPPAVSDLAPAKGAAEPPYRPPSATLAA